jgi:hypothetical protein
MNLMMMRRLLASAALTGLSMFAGCGGAGGSSDTTGSSGSTSSTSGSDCNYTDLVSSSERSQANACGIQVSGNYAQADSGLSSVIAACQQGQKTTADNYYATTYKQEVAYARSVSSALSCGTNTAPTPVTPSPQTYYNLCVKSTASGGGITYSGSCWGPVHQSDGGCSDASYSYLNQHASLSACVTARDSWLNSH